MKKKLIMCYKIPYSMDHGPIPIWKKYPWKELVTLVAVVLVTTLSQLIVLMGWSPVRVALSRHFADFSVTEECSYLLSGISRAMFYWTVRLSPVGVCNSHKKSDYAMYDLCYGNMFRWLSDSSYPQGYSLSRVKYKKQGSSVSGNAQLWWWSKVNWVSVL